MLIMVFLSSLPGKYFSCLSRQHGGRGSRNKLCTFPKISPRIFMHILHIKKMRRCSHHTFFPLYYLPADACFVIRCSELDKLMKPGGGENISPESPSRTRISTPLSRLFWLSCRRNDTISPLMNQPYKLLSILSSGHQRRVLPIT